MLYDVIVIGGGPAGLTSALYTARAGYKTLVLEEAFAGGQMTLTADIENYPGVIAANGFDLSMSMKEQAEKFGAEFATGKAISLIEDKNIKVVKTEDKEYLGKSIIVAAGAKRKKIGIPGEEKFSGLGVSYCATCDGAFYKGKKVAVIGGGDTALGEAMHLATLCEKVYLIHRREGFRAPSKIVETARKMKNIEFMLNRTPVKIEGMTTVTELVVLNKTTGEEEKIALSGVFVAVGTDPESNILRDVADLDENGYVLAGEDLKVKAEGIFVAGDLRKKPLRQIVTAASDGAVAAFMAGEYIMEKF